MQANKVSRDTIEHAAAEIGVSVDITAQNQAGTRHRVKLNSLVPPECRRPSGSRYRDERGDAPYQRLSASNFHSGRRVSAVCWHGFRDFFRAVYRIEPNAVFATAFDTWRGSDDFEARFRESGHRNIGSQMYPMAAAEACRCGESGYVDTYRSDGPRHIPAVVTLPENHAQRMVLMDQITRAAFTNPVDTYGADEADGAACCAMANALRAARA